MFIDTRKIEQDTTIQAQVCIIGAGVAGITIALELANHGLDVVLLESGGYAPDQATRDLSRGESAGIPYLFADGCRSRYFGGSSNCWGGFCRPLDAIDFERRDWVAHSGWPFSRRELLRYYHRAHTVLRLGPQDFSPQFWEKAIARSDVKTLPLNGDKLQSIVVQFSPPARLGSLHHDEFKRSMRVRVFLYANALEIETHPNGHYITRVHIATLTGRRATVAADTFVLATGGIENARLLLASNRWQSAGIGNSHDLVGRFFMEHPRLLRGSIQLAKPWAQNMFYDIKFHYHNRLVCAHKTPVSANLAITAATQRREGLLNSMAWFSSVFPGENSEAAEALQRLKLALQHQDQPGYSSLRDCAALLRSPSDALSFALTRWVRPWQWIKEIKISTVIEPAPNPNSRVTLTTQRDPLGMQRVKVDWRMGALEQHTFDRTLALIDEELRHAGIGRVLPETPLEGMPWPKDLLWCYHHMGTTRMHDSPHHGVVDRNGRVHGIANLYIAGSSTFPTAGVNFPTITIAALALRLAEHLRQVVRRRTVYA